MKLKSKYKISGGFGLLILLNLGSASIVYVIVQKLIENSHKFNIWNENGTMYLIIFCLIFEGTFFALFVTQGKYIVIENESIRFVNPLFPFIKRTEKWSNYDYYYTVLESSRSGSYEAIWLIRNGKLKDRISSFYYTNYLHLKSEIKQEYKGELTLTQFEQVGCLLGLKRNL